MSSSLKRVSDLAHWAERFSDTLVTIYQPNGVIFQKTGIVMIIINNYKINHKLCIYLSVCVCVWG